MNEIETKILEINKEEIKAKIRALGAKTLGSGRLYVDWYKMPEHKKSAELWYLRIRNTFDGGYELTWKGKEAVENGIRTVREIHFHLPDHKKMRELLDIFGLVLYAHQEKDRTSFKLGNICFDLDVYPGILPFLEIEGPSVESVEKTIQILGLEKHERWGDGERTLVEEKYKMNWSAMKFV